MRTRIAAFFIMCSLPLIAGAQNGHGYRCTSGDLVRRIEVIYATAAEVPCEVHYFKDSEAPGEAEVLWRAASEHGYCENRADELAARLGGWGWTCAAAGVAVTDDTDALSAGEP